jgi:5-methyltetrahydrofolate corrinoid/iron sulfur protein methyltransferase
MFIIGEKINSSNRAVARAITLKDQSWIGALAISQLESGANALDINAAQTDNEVENLFWCAEFLRNRYPDVPLSIDTKNILAVERCLTLPGPFIINSVESDDIESCQDYFNRHDVWVIIQCSKRTNRIPPHHVIEDLVSKMERLGMVRWYYDVCVSAVAGDEGGPSRVLGELSYLAKHFPFVKTVAGLSNVSFGMPKRFVLNRTFLARLTNLSACILDPNDVELMDTLAAVEALYFHKTVEFCKRLK